MSIWFFWALITGALKLSNVVDWPWLAVVAPLLASFVLSLGIVGVLQLKKG